MKLSTYVGESLQDALRQAKAELGDDVVLLESRELTGKGMIDPSDRNRIQITVTVLDGNENPKRVRAVPPKEMASEAPQQLASNPFTEILKAREELTRKKQAAQAFSTPVSEGDRYGGTMANEIAVLRHELNKLNLSLRRMITPEFPEKFSRFYEKLLEAGLANEDANAIIRRAYLRSEKKENIAQKELMQTIKEETMLPLELSSPVLPNAKGRQFIALVGPTGVGKTTTVMKMAAHPDIYGRRKAVIITTDTYRMAATEPLRVFSKIASVPVYEAKNPKDVLTIIKNQRDKDVFLIDTPGRSPFFPNYIQELQSYVGFSAEVKILLALSLTSDLEDMYLSTGLYSVLNPKAIIFTKLDETSRPGKMISMLQQFRLPLAYTCDGQAIPNDIHLPDENDLWNRIIKAVW